jgi:hypothetical protein
MFDKKKKKASKMMRSRLMCAFQSIKGWGCQLNGIGTMVAALLPSDSNAFSDLIMRSQLCVFGREYYRVQLLSLQFPLGFLISTTAGSMFNVQRPCCELDAQMIASLHWFEQQLSLWPFPTSETQLFYLLRNLGWSESTSPPFLLMLGFPIATGAGERGFDYGRRRTRCDGMLRYEGIASAITKKATVYFQQEEGNPARSTRNEQQGIPDKPKLAPSRLEQKAKAHKKLGRDCKVLT